MDHAVFLGRFVDPALVAVTALPTCKDLRALLGMYRRRCTVFVHHARAEYNTSAHRQPVYRRGFCCAGRTGRVPAHRCVSFAFLKDIEEYHVHIFLLEPFQKPLTSPYKKQKSNRSIALLNYSFLAKYLSFYFGN